MENRFFLGNVKGIIYPYKILNYYKINSLVSDTLIFDIH